MNFDVDEKCSSLPPPQKLARDRDTAALRAPVWTAVLKSQFAGLRKLDYMRGVLKFHYDGPKRKFDSNLVI
jgi:hypothetical protein